MSIINKIYNFFFGKKAKQDGRLLGLRRNRKKLPQVKSLKEITIDNYVEPKPEDLFGYDEMLKSLQVERELKDKDRLRALKAQERKVREAEVKTKLTDIRGLNLSESSEVFEAEKDTDVTRPDNTATITKSGLTAEEKEKLRKDIIKKQMALAMNESSDMTNSSISQIEAAKKKLEQEKLQLEAQIAAHKETLTKSLDGKNLLKKMNDDQHKIDEALIKGKEEVETSANNQFSEESEDLEFDIDSMFDAPQEKEDKAS